MTLTLHCQGQIWNLLYLSQKWSNCHETKSKHIDWTLGLKCDHRVWPWPWPWSWNFKVKYGFCYISAKNGAIATKRKANISIDLKASNATIRFDLGHDLDLEFSRSNMEFATSLPKMVRLPLNEKQTCRLNSRPQMWPMSLTLAMTLTFEFSRSNVILTISWPMSGFRIYQIVTGVTSDVGVPSTHLVWFRECRDACRDRLPAVSFDVGGGENVPGTPGACANSNLVYLVRGPWQKSSVCRRDQRGILNVKRLLLAYSPRLMVKINQSSQRKSRNTSTYISYTSK